MAYPSAQCGFCHSAQLQGPPVAIDLLVSSMQGSPRSPSPLTVSLSFYLLWDHLVQKDGASSEFLCLVIKQRTLFYQSVVVMTLEPW